MEFSFGIEHEVAFLNKEGQLADFSQVKFADFEQIIDQLPLYPDDYTQLRVGDAGIKKKRWYIECFERYENSEEVIDCVPKGIEIRTTIRPSIQEVVAELDESFKLLNQAALAFGFSPLFISFNPYQTVFEPDPPLNTYELEAQRQSSSPETWTQHIPMLTYGPDLSLSVKGISTEQIIDFGQKLTYYSPYLAPFSFNSPFYGGELWAGLSVRTFIRTGARPAVLVFIAEADKLIKSAPSLTKLARLPAEIGRIEFKAFDSCADLSLYAALLALLKGLLLDSSLPGRAITPDTLLHQHSARTGFADRDIYLTASKIVLAAQQALVSDADEVLLWPLQELLGQRKTPAHALIEKFKQTGSIEQVLRQSSAFGLELSAKI